MTEPAKKKAKPTIENDEEKDRLLSIWDLISKDLRSKVEQDDKASIDFLTESFPQETYPAKGSESAHCVFCHKTFDPRLPPPCSTEHDWDEGDLYQKLPPRYSYICFRCEETADVADDGCPGGCCREGVCSDDIQDRMDQCWNSEEDDFDECSVCMLKANEEESEDDEDNAEQNTNSAEVIVIDD